MGSWVSECGQGVQLYSWKASEVGEASTTWSESGSVKISVITGQAIGRWNDRMLDSYIVRSTMYSGVKWYSLGPRREVYV